MDHDLPHDCPAGAACPNLARLEELRAQLGRLQTQLRTDSLTGLGTRSHFDETLEIEIERSHRTGQPCSLIMLDVDHFKQINDLYGHPIGDAVLQQLGSIIKHAVRRIDIPCRYGGEEFAIILPSTAILVAKHVGERLRQNLADTRMELPNLEAPLAISASVGIAAFSPDRPLSSSTLVGLADCALYKAKRSGRNRVCTEGRDKKSREVSAIEKAALYAQDGLSLNDADDCD